MLRSFDDLGTPLHEVTFCVVDLETTGASPAACHITEIGAARFRGGERLGTFQTLVSPDGPIDPAVAALTGITDDMVRSAPPVDAVLPTLAEFVGGSVLVGHNLRFDVSFLDAALGAGGRPAVGLRTVDTVVLARRLLRDAVPDCRLATLAHHLDLPHRPTHRALDDVLATADLLHVLLERSAGFGVTLLDDLLQLPRLSAHPQVAKLRLTNRLPRSPGAYVLRDGQGGALDVGSHPVDLRRHVRSLFSGDAPPGSGPLLREVQAIEHVPCGSALAAAVAEIRLTLALRPRRSARLARWRTGRYVRPASGRTPRLSLARTPGRARGVGPLPRDAARTLVAALELVASLPPDPRPVAAVVDDLLDRPASVLSPLHRHAARAAAAGRHAQAVAVGEMHAVAAAAVEQRRWAEALRAAGRLVVETASGERVELDGGGVATLPDAVCATVAATGATPPAAADGALASAAAADEVAAVAAALVDGATGAGLASIDGELSCPAGDGATPSPAHGLRCAAC